MPGASPVRVSVLSPPHREEEKDISDQGSASEFFLLSIAPALFWTNLPFLFIYLFGSAKRPVNITVSDPLCSNQGNCLEASKKVDGNHGNLRRAEFTSNQTRTGRRSSGGSPRLKSH